MYIGVLLMYLNPLNAVFSLFAIIMLHMQILQEEKYLVAVFGDSCREYKKHVFLLSRQKISGKALLFILGLLDGA